jgi:methionyl-tRNA formyltransferase
MEIILFCVSGAGNDVIETLVSQGTPPSYVIPPNEKHYLRDRTIALAHKYNIPVVMFNDHPSEDAFIDRINELAPDLILVATFTHLIPESVYSAASIAAINAHPSLLPNYRGANPYFHVIANGESQTGVTLHLLDNNFDTGAILKQASMPIGCRDSSGTITKKLNKLMADELATMVKTIEKSGLPVFQEQSKQVKHKAPKIIPPLADIHWKDSAIYIDRYVRAANPSYHVFSTLNKTKVIIFSGKPINGYSSSSNCIIGEVLPAPKNEHGILVHTGDGAYLIMSLMYDSDWVGDAFSLFELGLVNVGDCFE